MHHRAARLVALPLTLFAAPALAQSTTPGSSADRLLGPGATAPAPAATEAVLPEVVVQARRAEAARQGILARFGAREYVVDRATIEGLPGGANLPLNQVLLQTPGVVQDSFGDIHVRGEHRNLQYRLNGVALPEGLSGFGQVFDVRALRSVSVLTGALPAQFGFRTNAVINLETRTGALDPGSEVGVFGGARGTVQPFGSYAGILGGWDVFATGNYLRSDQGIENPAPSRTATNGQSQQTRGLVYAARNLDDTTRLSVISGTALNRFRIPVNPGQEPAFTAFGLDDFDSRALRSRQWERTWFGVAAVQKQWGDVDLQVAPFLRYSSIHFVPSLPGDVLFNGIASDVRRSSLTAGVQTDASWRVAERHTLRAGFQFQRESSQFRSTSTVLPLDAAGAPVDDPFALQDRNSRVGWQYGAYVQDEWRITDRLTLNAGLRADHIEQYTSNGQLSPRLNIAYRPFNGTTLHAGYARTFTPAQQELVANPTLARFVGTTGAPNDLLNDTIRPERAHRFDLGVSQRFGGLTLGADAYYKRVRDLLDFGQFGNALIFTPFNYRQGEIFGFEFSGSYRTERLLTYANLAISRSRGRDIRSSQFNIDPDELAYAASKFVRTDHDQLLTGSAGIIYRVLDGTRVSANLLGGSGLRRGFANSEKLDGYTTFNVGAQQDFRLAGGDWTARVDVINLFDTRYQLRDGTGIGVGAPQYGTRLGVFGGISRRF